MAKSSERALERNVRIPRASQSPDEGLRLAYTLREELTERDLRSAIRFFEESSRGFSASGLRAKAALAELEAGDTYQMMSRYQEALRAYHRSVALTADLPNSRCTALAHISRTYANMGRNAQALPIAEKALALCEASSDRAALAYATEVQGEVQFWSGDIPAATKMFTHARQLALEAGDRGVEARSTMMLAQILHATSPEEASRLIHQAMDVWTDTGNRYEVARAHLIMAFFAGDEGKFTSAQCHCREALGAFERIADKDNAAIALNVLGLVANATGDAEAAEDYYRRARNDFSSAQDDLGEAESLVGLNGALAKQNRYQAILPLYRREIYLAQSTKNSGLLASAHLNIGDFLMHDHRYREAESHYNLSLSAYSRGGNTYGQGLVMMRLADLRIREGKLQQALAQLADAYAIKENTGEVEDRARIRYSRARVYLQLNRIDDARTEIEETISIIESQRLRIAKFDSRAQYVASVHDYYSLYIQVLMLLDRLHPREGYADRAFEAAERSKVRAFLDLIENTEPDTPCSGSSGGSGTESREGKTSEVRQTDSFSAHAFTLKQIQAEITDPATVLVEYSLGEDRSYVWLVDSKTASVHELAPAGEIHKRVQQLRSALLAIQTSANKSPLQYLQQRQTAQKGVLVQLKGLGRTLLGDLDFPPGARILFVPDGVLQNLPFAALYGPGDEPDRMPLVKQHEVILLSSASVLSALRTATAKRPPPIDEVTVFADPVFERQNNGTGEPVEEAAGATRSASFAVRADGGQSPDIIPRLPGSRREASAIQEVIGRDRTRLFSGFGANRDLILEGVISRDRIIHFATHGFADRRHPEKSGLLLSMFTESGEPRDGYLRLSDIYRLQLSADLVVLSACDSALGKDLGSEGVIGLPRGFLYAGARSVIASMWRVDDDATAVLMRKMYVRIKKGESVAEALRGAQLELMEGGQFADPFYWAAFALEGDFR